MREMREMREINFFFYDSEIHNYQRERFYISDNDKFFDSKIFKEFRFKFENIIHESYNDENDDFEYFSLLDKIYDIRDFYYQIYIIRDFKNFYYDIELYYYKIIISMIDDSIRIIKSSEYLDL